MLKTLLPLIAVFLIYNFVSRPVGLIALAAVVIGFLIIKWPTILMLRGNSRYNKGDRAGGLAMMEKAYKTGKLESAMVVYYSYCLLRENDYCVGNLLSLLSLFMLKAMGKEKVREVLDEYIASGKGSAGDICRAKHNKAIMLWKAGETDEAFAVMKEAHEAMPATDTYGTLGLIYLDLAEKKPELAAEAEAFLKEAYDYNADDRTIACNLGSMYLRENKLDEAEEIYSALVKTRPDSPTPYYDYARVLMAKESWDDAEDMLNHALRHPFTGVTAIKRADVEAALKTVDEKLAERETDENDRS